jgi:hypothetical protein
VPFLHVQYETAAINFSLDAVSISMESVKTFFKISSASECTKTFIRYQNCRGSFWKICVAIAMARTVLFCLSYRLANCQMRTVVLG